MNFRPVARRPVALLVAATATAALVAGCGGSGGAEVALTTTTAAAGASGAQSAPTPDVDHTAFCEQIDAFEAQFTDRPVTDADVDVVVESFARIAAAAPEYLADAAATVSEETAEVVSRAKREGRGLNDIPSEWYSDGYADASAEVFGAGFSECTAPATPAG